jgi:crotonobetainyl-CoA:carnitine CoA-transferase CaiB-like acyl-CoA transferase
MFADPRFATRAARIENHEALIEFLGSHFKRRTRADWCAQLLAQDVPHAPMYDPSEALDDEQARHLELTVRAHHPAMGAFTSVRSPVTFDGQRSLQIRPPPTLGEHNEEIRKALKTRTRRD